MLTNKLEVNNHVQMLDLYKMCPLNGTVDDCRELFDDLMVAKIRLTVEIQ